MYIGFSLLYRERKKIGKLNCFIILVKLFIMLVLLVIGERLFSFVAYFKTWSLSIFIRFKFISFQMKQKRNK
jgi:hypothetical protein